MRQPNEKILQYLNEAHATESGLVRVLQSQIAMTPRGTYRNGLEKHLGETREHAERLRARMRELGDSAGLLQAGIGLAESVAAQALALGKTPLDVLRGHGGEEKVLKNAKDAAATEALEIATYTAIEELAKAIGDDATARLAASIRADEQRMLDRIRALRAAEPWPGYDEMNVDELRRRLADVNESRARAVRDYERAHKNRAGVIDATERELANA